MKNNLKNCAGLDKNLECNAKSNNSIKARNTKIIIIFIALAIIITALVFLSVKFFIPGYHYAKGNALFQEEKYTEAITEFVSAIGYKDALEKAAIAEQADHYSNGSRLLNSNKYEEAILEFQNANGYADSSEKIKESYYLMGKEYFEQKEYLNAAEKFSMVYSYEDAQSLILDSGKALLELKQYADAAKAFNYYKNAEADVYVAYSNAMLFLEKKDYASAIASFKEAGNVFDAPGKYKDTCYIFGLEQFKSEDFYSAQKYFEKCSDYKDANAFIKVCQAEQYIKVGNLASAYRLYKSFPEDLKVSGFDVQGRIDLLSKYKPFINICKKWNPEKYRIETNEVYNRTGSREGWYYNESDGITGQYLSINCYINGKGTVDIKGTVSFYRYINYSSLKKYLYSPILTTKTFSVKDITSVPKSIYIDDDTTLEYSNGAFKLLYSKKDDYSMHFYYLYKTSITFS